MSEHSVPQPCETIYWVAGVSNPHGDGRCSLSTGKREPWWAGNVTATVHLPRRAPHARRRSWAHPLLRPKRDELGKCSSNSKHLGFAHNTKRPPALLWCYAGVAERIKSRGRSVARPPTQRMQCRHKLPCTGGNGGDAQRCLETGARSFRGAIGESL